MKEVELTVPTKLLAMMLVHDMKDASQGVKAEALNRAGLSNPQIAELLGTTSGVINQQLYERRKSNGTKRRRAAPKRTAGPKGRNAKKARRRH